MAEFSIDQKKLPPVKDVCRDFAVLEDHCLAHNLQEQEIESHLASNVHKSRLAQHDLKVAKLLQEEEDMRAKAQSKRQFRDLERQDNEIAQGIQEELVRQAEQQILQEEKDMAIARKMQEKEMKEERKRQKKLEANFEEEYFEDEGGRPDKKGHPAPRSHSGSPGRFDEPPASGRPREERFREDPASPYSRSQNPKHYLAAEGDAHPEHSLPPRGRHGDRPPGDHPGPEAGRARGPRGEEAERVVRRKERPPRPPPIDLDRDWDRDRERDHERQRNRERERVRDRDRERDPRRGPERPRARGPAGDHHREPDRQRDTDRRRARTPSRERVLEEEGIPRKDRTSWGDEEVEGVVGGGDDGGGDRRGRGAGGRQRVPSDPDAVFEEHWSGDGPRSREGPGRERCHTHPPGEPGTARSSPQPAPLDAAGGAVAGRIVHRAGGTVIAGQEYGLSDATQGLTRLDLRDQEVIDMEVARRLQEEEILASNKDKHAAQVAQDEEIARLLAEQEKKEYKKIKEREKEKERMMMDRMAQDKKRQEAGLRPHAEDVVRPRDAGRPRDDHGGPRTREELEHHRQRNHNKPTRPPQPRTPNYENVNPGPPYGYSDNPFPPRGNTRPEAAYKGGYYRQ
ncbi:coiled-coil domain-containing protein 50 isoform X2 [Gadus morhua]|uniref:coiled-coil domain-containing protein 50 isoform X2 n=1 Tax=Gadus morhua TaxID=8049 RepID=UPI0011B5EE9D|nr:coiled-coil domain-containing protein 50 isoform X2 [Gadus morhua]